MEVDLDLSAAALSYANWKSIEAATPLRGTEEYPLFSDARIIGELKDAYGPYRVFSTVSHQMGFSTAPTMILRVDYAPGLHSYTNKVETNIARYHGGGLQDEIAALLSLLVGIRVKAGGMNRFFESGKDPKGHPIYPYSQKDPIPFPPPDRPILASALGEHNLDDAELLSHLLEITPAASIPLIRASRLYQDALWIVESETSLAWVMLVSAIETAAGFWKSGSEPAVERLWESKPDLAKLLHDSGGDALLTEVAEMIADSLGAGKKFREFLLTFLPPPPAVRPSELHQHPWEEAELRKSFQTIYKWRSEALHNGIPFPQPMCWPPIPFESGTPAERSSSPAMGGMSGMWKARDTPMYLHTFEHIVRGAIIGWWRSMIKSE